MGIFIDPKVFCVFVYYFSVSKFPILLSNNNIHSLIIIFIHCLIHLMRKDTVVLFLKIVSSNADFYFKCVCVLLGIRSRASIMQGICSSTELHSQPLTLNLSHHHYHRHHYFMFWSHTL